MDAVTLLQRALSSGLTVKSDGELLVVTGPRTLEPLATQLLDRKAEVLALLAAPAPTKDRNGCLDCGTAIGTRYVRCDACAASRAVRRPELPPPCPECRAFHWSYDLVDVRRCVECGHTVELPPLHDSAPQVVSPDAAGLVSWESCHCSEMPEGPQCRACAATATARWKSLARR